jgi:hypothetical protein
MVESKVRVSSCSNESGNRRNRGRRVALAKLWNKRLSLQRLPSKSQISLQKLLRLEIENTVEREDEVRSMTLIFLGEGLSNQYSSNSISRRGMPSLARNGCQKNTGKVRERNAYEVSCQAIGLRIHPVFILRGLRYSLFRARAKWDRARSSNGSSGRGS